MQQGLRVASLLIRRDLHVFFPSILNGFIDSLVWSTLTLTIFSYSSFTVGSKAVPFAVFMACGNIAVWGLFEIIGHISKLVGDLTGRRSIEYDLTLPLPQWMVFVALGISNGMQSMLLSIFVLPISKIILWNQFDLSTVSWGKFFLIFLQANLFYGFFALCLASLMDRLDSLKYIWRRIVSPVWLTGGFTFTWMSAYQIFPRASYLMLLNPLLCAVEGIRGAILGQQDYINFWYCSLALMGLTSIVAYIGISRMMRRLDCL